ncbi:hypothetical protein CC86DRAFT_131951 [Ophiobolus disseminans]|uniref:glucan endo-1,3-beta-D-glucosidase n=1 Tax=Ophiobolus disseminans TaxID=1469910 RepID=A0A6A6ZFV6_9PLEO|nr:hypothetical protein CC86DRAFT_131951 [Ophiobolus disseminans]
MAVAMSLLLALAQLSFVIGLPAGDAKHEPALLDERAIQIATDLQPTISYSTAIESLQSASITVLPSMTGSIPTNAPSGGGFTKDPIRGPGATQSEKPLCPLETPLEPGATAPVKPISENIFQAIETGLPARSIPWQGGHLVKKDHVDDGDVPIQTNKFYANFFLGSQSHPVWTHPYHLVWAKGAGETRSYGMAISHTVREQFAFADGPVPQYFISPIGIHHMILSAAELGSDTILSVEAVKAFSVYADLAPSKGKPTVMSIPCVQGMGMITAIYNDAKPLIKSGVFFRTFDFIKEVSSGTYKWRAILNDNSQWLVYVTPSGSIGVPPFVLTNSSLIEGPSQFKGYIQVTKNPAGEAAEDAFDASAGTYATDATISGSVNGGQGGYTLSWGKGGVQNKPLLMYALPHHVESFDQQTKSTVQKDIRLVTTTKGYAQAVLANKITMLEDDLPDTIGFAPWVKNANGAAGGSENVNIGASALALVNNAAHSELSQNFIEQTKLNSMYYSGKGLAKFASIIYTVSNIAGNRNLAASGIVKLKDAFNVFVNNTQPEPLLYDTVWKGVVSGATYRNGDPGLDFGNTLYNDHHFHYGYFVYAAAVIGYLDPEWLDQGINKAWVNSLVRDYANPVTDEYFPFQRSFDWFHGHSWAKGLFESGDGKDQESTSEDTFATYALKMWGKIIRDPNMEARGNLQLAVQARSIRNYFLMSKDNKNQPERFLPNKVTGILFENKIDHTTYFGANPEYIEGIHMIPLNPSSAYTRPKQFVLEEWDTYFSNGRADKVEGGWKSILYANYALVNPQAAYSFFANPEFNTHLDGGASRTWYLTYTAALLNSQTGSMASDATMNYTTEANENDTESKDDDQDVQEPEASGKPNKGGWPVGFDWPKPGDASRIKPKPGMSVVYTASPSSSAAVQQDAQPSNVDAVDNAQPSHADAVDNAQPSHIDTTPNTQPSHIVAVDNPQPSHIDATPNTNPSHIPSSYAQWYAEQKEAYTESENEFNVPDDDDSSPQDDNDAWDNEDVEGRSSDDEWDWECDGDEDGEDWGDEGGYDDAWKMK